MNADPLVVAKLLEQFARRIHEEDGVHGLTLGQWAILRFVGLGGAVTRTPRQVANYLGISDQHAQAAITSLGKRGLLSLACDAHGTVVLHMCLTSAAAQLMVNDPIHRLATALKGMPQGEREQLARLVEATYARLDAAPDEN